MMRLCNEAITVVNPRFDMAADDLTYAGTIIRGVSWYSDIASTVDSSGLKAASKFTIRIPVDADFSGKAYVDPRAYDAADPARAFTLRNGDIILKGAVDVTGLRPRDMQARYEAVTVLGVTDNRRAPNARHWKVVGK